MRRRHRHGRQHSLLNLLAPRCHSTTNLVRDVALGAFIAREIINK